MTDTLVQFRRRGYVAAILWILPVLLSAQSRVQQNPGEHLQALVRADWESAKPAPDRWPDLSPDGLRNREAQDRATLLALHALSRDSLSGEGRTLYDLLEWDLSRRLEQFRLRLYLTPFWNDVRFGQSILGIYAAFSQPAPTSPAEYELRIRKLESFPSYVQQHIRLMRQAIQVRMMPSRESAFASASGTLQLLQALDKSPSYNRFVSAPQEAGPDRARLQEEANNLVRERVLPALKEFYDVLTKEYLPDCPGFASLSEWPNGGEVYRELARRYTTVELDPKELHEYGLSEVARIRSAMAAVVLKTGFNGSLDDFLTGARTDKRFYFGNDVELLAAYRAAVARIEPLVPRIVHRLPRISLRVEPDRSGGVAARYRAPVTGDREGVVMVDVARPEIRPKFEIIPLMLHEGMPGHHLQGSLAQEFQADSSRAEAEMALLTRRNDAFSEGWALYAETLGDELGLYSDPYDKFGQLSQELVRAVRVVVDTGVHAYEWSAAKTKQYFIAQTGKADAVADSEVLRSVRPGEPLAYKVGQERIKAMRDRAARALGRSFDVRSFHDTVLRWGPLPLGILERKLDECLKSPDCSVTFKAVP